MSHEGKMFRGEAYVNRDPKSLRPSEKEDLDYFLANSKKEEPAKVEPKKTKIKEKE